MSARRGTLTMTRYFVQGSPPRDLRQRYLQAVRLRAFSPLTPEGEATEAIGWCAMERPFDLQIEPDKIFHGQYLLLGLRVDRWRIPASLVSAHAADEEQRLLAKLGRDRLGRDQKKELRERVAIRLRRKSMPSTRAYDVVWDLDGGTVLFFSQSKKTQTEFLALFEKTFSLELLEDSPYVAAQRSGIPKAVLRGLEKVEPQSLLRVRPVQEAEPRAAGATEAPLIDRVETTRFLGSEFLLWLWMRTELVKGGVPVPETGEVEVWLEQQIILESAIDANERVTVRGASPSDSAEALEAVRAQKFPVRARLVMQSAERHFACGLVAPRFALSGAAVPEILKDDADEAFLERMELAKELMTLVDRLYAEFLKERLSERFRAAWEPAMASFLQGKPIPRAALEAIQPRPKAARKRTARAS